jgi:redox-sensitive bicupin YhaK (pirin superfamily)
MLDGVIEHRDSMGGGGTITDGATQWMTAGAGIVHSEMPPEYLVRSGGLFHGVQLWVNLGRPQVHAARYQEVRPGDVGLAASPDGGSWCG